MDPEVSTQQSRDRWIAADWGTTRLRVWHIGTDGQVLASASSDDGMSRLASEQFEAALLSLVAPWITGRDTTDVLACGMVGARQGWIEAPYRQIPCSLVSDPSITRAPSADRRLNVRIAAGLCQQTPADVMRGEETQLLGLMMLNNTSDGIACMPGTHAKWVQISDGCIERFRTMMTGEIFALLSQHSVLKHSVATDEWDEQAFLLGVERGFERSSGVLADLFSIRAQGLLQDTSAAAAIARLSGLLIGDEIANVSDILEDTTHVTLIGQGPLCERYQRALQHLGCTADIVDGTDAVLSGLTHYRRLLTG